MTRIPMFLVLSRVAIALVFIFLLFFEFDFRNKLIAMLIIIGVITDIFDGIIARKLNVATERLRVWDSNADVLFWISAIFSVFWINSVFLREHLLLISAILGAEILVYLISFIKFRRPVATHTYLAKAWTLILLCFMIELILFSDSGLFFYLCIILGFISRLEIGLILINLKSWQTDVPSYFSVRKMNENENA